SPPGRAWSPVRTSSPPLHVPSALPQVVPSVRLGVSRLTVSLTLLPADFDFPEALGLLELNLSLTVKLQDGQEPHHHIDALQVVLEQVPEARFAHLRQAPAQRLQRPLHGRPYRGDVGQVHGG